MVFFNSMKSLEDQVVEDEPGYQNDEVRYSYPGNVMSVKLVLFTSVKYFITFVLTNIKSPFLLLCNPSSQVSLFQDIDLLQKYGIVSVYTFSSITVTVNIIVIIYIIVLLFAPQRTWLISRS